MGNHLNFLVSHHLKVKPFKPKALTGVFGDEKWYDLAEQNEEEMVKTVVTFPFEEFPFEKVVPSVKSKFVSILQMTYRNGDLCLDKHICVTKLKDCAVCSLLC